MSDTTDLVARLREHSTHLRRKQTKGDDVLASAMEEAAQTLSMLDYFFNEVGEYLGPASEDVYFGILDDYEKESGKIPATYERYVRAGG